MTSSGRADGSAEKGEHSMIIVGIIMIVVGIVLAAGGAVILVAEAFLMQKREKQIIDKMNEKY